MDNLKNKMVEWFECHPTALEDLSNFCGRKSKRMLNEMNKDINKVYVGDTSFSVIKRILLFYKMTYQKYIMLQKVFIVIIKDGSSVLFIRLSKKRQFVVI